MKEEKGENKTKCYFSTFIDEVTITCTSDARGFDFYGWPIKECPKLSTCNIIKEKNENYKLARLKNKK